MVHKKAIATVVLSTLLAFSASAFAGPTYSVEDTVARERLQEIIKQLEDIKMYLDVVKEKDLSMDVLNKAATERKNDSMRKLSLENGLNIVSNKDFNLQGILGSMNGNFPIPQIGAGKGGFTGALGQVLFKENQGIFGHIDQTQAAKVSVEDYVKQLEGIKDGRFYNGLTTAAAVNSQHENNKKVCQELASALIQDSDKIDVEKTKADDKDNQLMEDVSKAKDSRSKESDNLWSTIGGFGSILKNTGIFNGKSLFSGGKISYGSVLDDTNIKTLLNRDDTESVTAAQERTTNVQNIALARKIRDGKYQNFKEQTKIKLAEIQLAEQQDDIHHRNKLAEISRDQLKNLEVSATGSELKFIFSDDN